MGSCASRPKASDGPTPEAPVETSVVKEPALSSVNAVNGEAPAKATAEAAAEGKGEKNETEITAAGEAAAAEPKNSGEEKKEDEKSPAAAGEKAAEVQDAVEKKEEASA